jgi:hypothetical protein
MLSMAFIQAALRKRGVLPQGRITSVRVLSQRDGGPGATIARLALTYDGAPEGAPSTLVARIATGEDALAAAREDLRFHRLDAPLMDPPPRPRLLGAAAGLEQDRLVLLFEDVETPSVTSGAPEGTGLSA